MGSFVILSLEKLAKSLHRNGMGADGLERALEAGRGGRDDLTRPAHRDELATGRCGVMHFDQGYAIVIGNEYGIRPFKGCPFLQPARS